MPKKRTQKSAASARKKAAPKSTPRGTVRKPATPRKRASPSSDLAIDAFDLESQTGWTLGEGEFRGKPTLVRCRQDLDLFVGHPGWPRRLVVTWPYAVEDTSGMPSSEDIDTMKVFEDAVVPALERDKTAILAFVFTHGGARSWHLHFEDAGLVQARINEALDGLPAFPIEFSAQDDPNWDEYRAVLAGGED